MLRPLGYVGRRFGKSPQDLAKTSVKTATDFLLDMLEELEKEGRSGSYTANMVKAVSSWLDFNDVQVVKKIRITGRGQLTRTADEKPPRPEELRSILNAADLHQSSEVERSEYDSCGQFSQHDREIEPYKELSE